MKKVIVFTVIIGAIYFFKPDLFSSMFVNGAFDKEGKPVVWLFTNDNCGSYCSDVSKLFDSRNIDYIEYDVNGEEGKARLSDIGGTQIVPLTVVGSKQIKGNAIPQIISMLAEELGEEALTRTERRVMTNHFYEGGEPMVVMYGTSWCNGCKSMRIYFEKNNIDYTEFDAEGSGRDAYNVLTAPGYPLMYVGYRRIDGVDIKRLEKAMKDFDI